MGLLASGAAHELGTPLATLSVILGDWRRLPAFSSDPELLGDIEEMQAQVQRCKSIVTRILLAAGETRGDAPVETTLHAFLDAVVGDWRTSRACDVLEYRNLCREDPRIVADTGLRQMAVLPGLQHALQDPPVRRRTGFGLDPVHVPGAGDPDFGRDRLQAGLKPFAAERRQGRQALEDDHVRTILGAGRLL